MEFLSRKGVMRSESTGMDMDGEVEIEDGKTVQ